MTGLRSKPQFLFGGGRVVRGTNFRTANPTDFARARAREEAEGQTEKYASFSGTVLV
jgi:hypothetical protein